MHLSGKKKEKYVIQGQKSKPIFAFEEKWTFVFQLFYYIIFYYNPLVHGGTPQFGAAGHHWLSICVRIPMPFRNHGDRTHQSHQLADTQDDPWDGTKKEQPYLQRSSFKPGVCEDIVTPSIQSYW